MQGLAFLDEDHLAVLTQDGMVSVYTLDVEELVEILTRSITREFTQTECERYGFEDTCPALGD
ncbi:MAG TPA: hypothetical protein VMM14_03770 [Acidimicrobiia bacterium]|nr:hypothetical protein [Acidimicrobiia bacterium]